MYERRPILLELALAWSFKVLRMIWNSGQTVLWWMCGVQAQVRLTQRKERFSQSAQVMSIIWKNAFDPIVDANDPSYFITMHRSFTHPHRVLRDEVSLFSITDKWVYFVEAPPGVEVWKNKYGAFHKPAQVNNAKYLIRIPLYAFLEIAEYLGDPKQNLIFINFVIRSGSTLLCHMFEKSGTCLTYSEPDALMNVVGNHSIPADEQRKLVRAKIRYMCKPREATSHQVEAIAFKFLGNLNSMLTRHCKACFPNAKYLLTYRNGLKSIASIDKLLRGVNHGRLKRCILEPMPAVWRRHWIQFISYGIVQHDDINDVLHKTQHFDEVSAGFSWANRIHWSLETQSINKIKVAGVKFEDLLENPEASIRAIFRYCGLPHDDAVVMSACKALEYDSQEKSSLARNVMRKVKQRKLSDDQRDEIVRDINVICDHLGVPHVDLDIRLPATVSVAKEMPV